MIALDLSRLLSRAGRTTPTGIDRVEMAYARHLVSSGTAYCFVARNGIGGIGLLPTRQAAEFVAQLTALWRDGASSPDRQRLVPAARRLRISSLFNEGALRTALRAGEQTPIYLSVSQQHLDQARPVARLKQVTRARVVCLIHDVIPLDFPHLTRPGQTRRHYRRLATVAAHADAVIANSKATQEGLVRHLGERRPLVTVAPLGIDLPNLLPAPATDEHPYFVCIGTIEARKNQRLLLDVWWHLATELGDRAPRLKLIGRRGFGAEHFANRLKVPYDLVQECPDLPDAKMATLLRGARTLLFPSLAEGFGLPVVEALAQRVPVLCSGLPALREAGGDVPDYLDPIDTAGWCRAILDHVGDSWRREAQLARLARWQPPSWSNHFKIVDGLIDDLSSSARDGARYRRDRPALQQSCGFLQ